MFRTALSAAAIATALTLSGGAMAQTMVGGYTVSDEDLPKVQAQCDTLALDENESPATADETKSETEAEAEVNHIDEVTTGIDLSTITLEQCEEAGLIGDAAM